VTIFPLIKIVSADWANTVADQVAKRKKSTHGTAANDFIVGP
jgi:hypothetical protein